MLSAKENLYVEAARALGAVDATIMWRHVLPNVVAPIIVLATLGLGTAILSGEVWRVATGPWVHFSFSHFLYDVLVLGMAGWMIESHGYPHFGWVCTLTPLVTGLTMLALQPKLEICGGLSGLATAAVVFLALYGWGETGAWRWICLLALIATTAKIWIEMTTGQFVFLQPAASSFVPVPSNHILGALTALAIYLRAKSQNRAGVA